MKGIGTYGGYVVGYAKSFSSSLPMCNNSSKGFNGRIYRVLYQESEVNYFDLLVHEVDHDSLLHEDMNLCGNMMLFDRNDYFTEDRAM